MSTVGIFDAKTHFSHLIDRVLKGEQITVTRHGVAVARIVPVQPLPRDPADTERLIKKMESFRKRRSLGGLKIRDLINEGRR